MKTDLSIEPVRKSVTVARPAADAFRVFTDEIHRWWPLERYSVFGERASTVSIEACEGGSIVERSSDGDESRWGEVLVWEPPHRLVISWHPNPDAAAATEIDVRFFEEDGSARVELEHRGWARLGDEAAEARDSYDSGWPLVLARYGDVAVAS